MTDSIGNQTNNLGRILVVDDSELSRRVIARSLQRWGYASAGCGSAGEALRFLRDNVASAMITDVELSDMDGLALARAAFELCPGLPVILMAAHPDPELVLSARAQGAREVLSKQDGGEVELHRTIRTALAPPEPDFEHLELAHSLRTPLTALKASIELMCRGDLPESQQRFAGIAQRNVNRLISLVETILADSSAKP